MIAGVAGRVFTRKNPVCAARASSRWRSIHRFDSSTVKLMVLRPMMPVMGGRDIISAAALFAFYHEVSH
jgi:hypothetical protein